MNDGAQTTTAATSQAGTVPAAEPNTLESLITEFDKGTAPDAAPVAKLLRAIQPVIVRAEQDQIKATTDQFVKDFDSAAAELKTVPGAEALTQRALKGFLREYGSEVPEVEKAWNNRQINPEAWNTALAKTKAALAEDLKANPPSTLKADTEAARAAVRNSSQSPMPTPELTLTEKANMSDRDWQNYMRGRIGTAQRR